MFCLASKNETYHDLHTPDLPLLCYPQAFSAIANLPYGVVGSCGGASGSPGFGSICEAPHLPSTQVKFMIVFDTLGCHRIPAPL